jgi:hypothetical protein
MAATQHEKEEGIALKILVGAHLCAMYLRLEAAPTGSMPI